MMLTDAGPLIALASRRDADQPMDLGDASIVVVADTLGTKQVFTLDQDFHIYRLNDGSALDIVP